MAVCHHSAGLSAGLRHVGTARTNCEAHFGQVRPHSAHTRTWISVNDRHASFVTLAETNVNRLLEEMNGP